MDIIFEETQHGGKLIAVEDDIKIGWIRWRVADGMWIYDDLFVAETHRGQHISLLLQKAAMDRRIAEGDLPWVNTPTTSPGTAAVNSHVNTNYKIDPRKDVNGS